MNFWLILCVAAGFLTCHLTAQYPEIFTAAATRNPVTNIAAMATTSDIPDWCYVEAIGLDAYDFNSFRGPKGKHISHLSDMQLTLQSDVLITVNLLMFSRQSRLLSMPMSVSVA